MSARAQIAGAMVGAVVLMLATAFFPNKYESRADTLPEAYKIAVGKIIGSWQHFAVSHRLPEPTRWDWTTCKTGDGKIVVATISAAIPVIGYATVIQSRLPFGGWRVRVGNSSTPPPHEACEPLNTGEQ